MCLIDVLIVIIFGKVQIKMTFFWQVHLENGLIAFGPLPTPTIPAIAKVARDRCAPFLTVGSSGRKLLP